MLFVFFFAEIDAAAILVVEMMLLAHLLHVAMVCTVSFPSLFKLGIFMHPIIGFDSSFVVLRFWDRAAARVHSCSAESDLTVSWLGVFVRSYNSIFILYSSSF